MDCVLLSLLPQLLTHCQTLERHSINADSIGEITLQCSCFTKDRISSLDLWDLMGSVTESFQIFSPFLYLLHKGWNKGNGHWRFCIKIPFWKRKALNHLVSTHLSVFWKLYLYFHGCISWSVWSWQRLKLNKLQGCATWHKSFKRHWSLPLFHCELGRKCREAQNTG